MVNYYDNGPEYTAKTCPRRKEHDYLRGQKCDTCGTYFRGDQNG
jgi:transposase